MSDAVGWPMINFRVTKTAKEVLKEMIKRGESEHGYKSLVPAILWIGDGEGKNFAWGVGFYERSRIVMDWIVSLDGMEFYIDPVDLPKLDGQTLDYIDNKLKVLMPQKH